MYVTEPKNWCFFRKIRRSKTALFVNMGLAASFLLDKSIFFGQIYFHWSILTCEIYDVRHSAAKTFFSENPLLTKGFVGLELIQWTG